KLSTPAAVFLTDGSSCCSAPAARRLGRRHRRRSRVHSKESLEKVAGSLGRSRNSAGYRDGASPPDLSLRVCFRFDIRRRVRTRHLRSRVLRLVGIFFVLASEISSRIMVGHVLDHLEGIGLICGREPGNLHVELAFVECERALQNSGGDWASDAAAMLATLHHHCNDILRMLKWRETSKPCNSILVAAVGGLSSACFASNLGPFQTRPATSSSVFVNNLPKAFAHELDFVRR